MREPLDRQPQTCGRFPVTRRGYEAEMPGVRGTGAHHLPMCGIFPAYRGHRVVPDRPA
ncbi:MAG: hypothetical protein ACFFGP_08765 [Promethearchaeota archaeon]